MLSNEEFQKVMDEMKQMNCAELIHLQFKVDNAIRERRLKDVIFYFNNFAATTPVNRHAKAAYEMLCRELQDLRRGHVLDTQLHIIEVLIQLD